MGLGSAALAAVMPLSLLVAYGALKLGASLFNELRDAIFSRVRHGAMRRVSTRMLDHLHRLSPGRPAVRRGDLRRPAVLELNGGGRELEVRERLLAAEARGMEEALRAFVRRLSQLSPEGARRALELVPQLYEAEHPA